jgi:hypothetical protein
MTLFPKTYNKFMVHKTLVNFDSFYHRNAWSDVNLPLNKIEKKPKWRTYYESIINRSNISYFFYDLRH